MSKILYIDMDGVLVDFHSGIDRLSLSDRVQYMNRPAAAPRIFSLMNPMPGAIDSYRILSEHFDTYILSTAPWENPSAWIDKRLRVEQYLGNLAYKRLILSHHKNLNIGSFLIDDRTKNGAGEFTGEHILFGSEQFPDRDSIIKYLLPLA